MTNPYAEVRDLFIARRKMLGISQHELAERMGVAQSQVSGMERLDRNPRYREETLVKWAEALRMELRIGIYLSCPEWKEPYFRDLTALARER